MMARLLLLVLLLRETHAGVQSAWCLLLAVPLILLTVGVHAQDAGILLSSAPTNNTSYVGLFSSVATDDPGVSEASPTEDSWSLWTSNPMGNSIVTVATNALTSLETNVSGITSNLAGATPTPNDISQDSIVLLSYTQNVVFSSSMLNPAYISSQSTNLPVYTATLVAQSSIISSQSLKEHVSAFLTSSLPGRDSGSPVLTSSAAGGRETGRPLVGEPGAITMSTMSEDNSSSGDRLESTFSGTSVYRTVPLVSEGVEMSLMTSSVYKADRGASMETEQLLPSSGQFSVKETVVLQSKIQDQTIDLRMSEDLTSWEPSAAISAAGVATNTASIHTSSNPQPASDHQPTSDHQSTSDHQPASDHIPPATSAVVSSMVVPAASSGVSGLLEVPSAENQPTKLVLSYSSVDSVDVSLGDASSVLTGSASIRVTKETELAVSSVLLDIPKESSTSAGSFFLLSSDVTPVLLTSHFPTETVNFLASNISSPYHTPPATDFSRNVALNASSSFAWPTSTTTNVDGLDLKTTASANSLFHILLETSMEPYSVLLDVSTESTRLQHLSQYQTETPSMVDFLTANPEGTLSQVEQSMSGHTGQSTELVLEMSSVSTVSTVSTDASPNSFSSTPTSSSSLHPLDGITSPAFAFSSSSPMQNMTDAAVVSGSASTVHAQTPSMQPSETLFAPAASSLTTDTSAARNIETLEVSSDWKEFKLTSMPLDSLSGMLSESLTETLTGFHSSVVQSDYLLTGMHATQDSSPPLMLSSSISEVQDQPTSTFLVPERSETTYNFGEISLALATETSSVHYLFSSTTVLTSETSFEPSSRTFTLAESHVQFLSGTLATQSTAALPVQSGFLETLGSSMSGLSHSSELLSPAVTAAETIENVSTSATPSVLQPADWSHSLAPSSTITPTLPYLEMTSTSDMVVMTETPPTKSVPLFSSLETFSSNPSSIISLPVVIEESSLSDVFSSDVLVTDALPLSSFFSESSSGTEVVTSSLRQSSGEFPPSQTSIVSKTPPISETHLESVSSPVVDSMTILPMFSQTETGVPNSTYKSLVEHTTGIQPSEALTAISLIPVSSSQESSFAVVLSPSPALTPPLVTSPQSSEKMTVSETYYVTPTENVSIFEVRSSSSETLPYSQETVTSLSLETWPYSPDTVLLSHESVISTMKVTMQSLYSDVSPTGSESQLTSLDTRLSSEETSPFTSSPNVETLSYATSSSIEISPVTTFSAESSPSTTSSSVETTVSTISLIVKTLTTVFSVEIPPSTTSSVAISPFATSSFMEISPSTTSTTEILPFPISSAEMESSSPSHRPETEVVISTFSTESYALSLSEALQSSSLAETLVSEMQTSSFSEGSGEQGLSTLQIMSLSSESSSSEIVDKSSDIRLDSSDWTASPSEVSVIHSTLVDSTSFHISSTQSILSSSAEVTLSFSTEILTSPSTEITSSSSTEIIPPSSTEGIPPSSTLDSTSFHVSTNEVAPSSSTNILAPSTEVVISSAEVIPASSTEAILSSSTEGVPSSSTLDNTSFQILSTQVIQSSSAEVTPPPSTVILASSAEVIPSSTTLDSMTFQISSTEVVQPSSAEVTPSSNAEDTPSSSTEMLASLSTEVIASSTEVTPSPSTELIASSTEVIASSTEVIASSTEVTLSPSTEILASPSTEVIASPSTEVIASSTEVTPSPSTEVIASSTEVTPSPSTEILASPSTEVIASPSTEVIASSTEILASPSTEVIASPSTEVIASPSTEVIASSTEVTSSPSTEILASPSTEVIASPSTEVTSSPSTEVIASPSTEVIASPSTEVTSSPSTEVIISPSTEVILPSNTALIQSSSTEAILPSSTEILPSSSVLITPSTTTTSQVVTSASTTAVPGLDFLVITVIKLQSGDNITSPEFVTQMEEGLARAYQIAFERQTAGGGARRRRSALLWQMVLVSTSSRSKRAVAGNVKVTMQSVQRQTTNPSNANLTYTVSKDDQMVSGARASETLNTLLDQEVALELNRVVVTVAEPAVQPQTTDTSEDKKLWIIAAVLGPVVLVILVLLVVCLLVRHSQQRREKGQTDHNEPHLLTVKHGPVSSNSFESSVQAVKPGDELLDKPNDEENSKNEQGGEGDVSENQERPSSSQSNGLLKSRPRKMVYEVNPYPDVPPSEARLQKKGRRSLKKNKASTALNGALNEENHPESTKEGTLKVKKKPVKESGAAQSEELEMSPMEPALQNVENMELSASSTLPRFQAQTSFEEEEEEFHDNAEEERKKNKQRQRLKKKQEMEAGLTIVPSDAHTAYERAQKEIDKVLGPRDSKSPPDVIAGSDRKRSKRRSKKGEVNPAYEQDENKPSGLQPKSALQQSESLEEVKSRIYSLLDDAFSLLSNNRANLGNGVVPSAGAQEDISRATRQDTLKIADDNRRGKPSDKKVSEGVLTDVETTFGPKLGEMMHTPIYVDRTHGAYDPDSLVSLNPYRASEESGNIVLTDNKPSTILAPAQEKTTTTVSESEAWATPDKYSATKATRPTIRTYQQPENTTSHKRNSSGSDKGVASARAALHKDRQLIADSEETSDIGYSRTESYNGIPTLRASESRTTYPTYREDSLNISNDHNMFAPSHEDSLANASIPIHQPPTRNVGDKDEIDVISASLAPGASPKELVDSIRQELQTITGKLGTKDLSSQQTPETGTNGKPPVRKPRKASYKHDHIPEIQW